MKKIFYSIGKLNEKEQLELDFADSFSRSIEERINLGFIPMKLPVINDVKWRAFDTMKDYRRWANDLPEYLGYYPAK